MTYEDLKKELKKTIEGYLKGLKTLEDIEYIEDLMFTIESQSSAE